MNIITSDFLQRTLCLKIDSDHMGSCFGLSINNKMVLITAKHLVRHITSGSKVECNVFYKDEWHSFDGTPIYNDDKSDIAILESDVVFEGNTNTNPIFSETILFGDDVYFLGFPYFGNQILRYPSISINNNFPLPMIKKATLSGAIGDEKICFLDGHNNPGFSGGPIIYFDSFKKKFVIFGIISGYITHMGKIVVSTTNKPNAFYKENSGIIVGYTISKANDLLKERFGLDLMNTKA